MENKVKTRVVFKIIPPDDYGNKVGWTETKEVIAFLLDAPADCGNILTYMHVGQHAEATVDFYRHCWTASPDEYADLKAELEVIGYELIVLKKCNPMRKVMRA